MTTVTVRGGFDTFAASAWPSAEFNGTPFLRVQGTDQYTYLYLKNPAPRGATIVSAKLLLKTRGTWDVSQTITARRIAGSWKVARLNWNNKPSVFGVARTAAVSAGVPDGTVVEVDVTQHVQSVVNGSAHYGWRLETDAAGVYRFYGLDAARNHPTLVVTYSDKPGTPVNLSPAGGVVSVSHPVVQFDYDDINGDDLASVQVQIDPAANGSSPGFDSGEVVSDVPELDLAATAYLGLGAGSSTQWRARVKDSGGLWSDWSDWETFSRVDKSTLTIDNPAVDPSNFVTEPTPPIIWTFGGVQTAWQVRITRGDDPSVELYNSGRRKGTETSHTLPKRDDNGSRLLVDDRDYRVNVRVWDDVDREVTPGDPRFTYAWRTFTMDDDATVGSAENVTAVQEGDTPWVALSWTRATAPDSFVIMRNGRVVESGLDPADLLNGGVYEWRDATARPRRTHTYKIKAVVNGAQSPPSAGATVETTPTGVWVIDYDRDLWFALSGLDVENWRYTDQGVMYQPLGSPVSVRIVQGLNGMVGAFTGTMRGRDGRTTADLEADLWQIKEQPAGRVRLVADDMSIPVKIHDLSCTLHPESDSRNPQKLVSFQFRQVGALPFEARV